MNNVPDNELLSAYLDGEVTAEQQAEVERLLAENPAARQLLDELRALSSTLQEMPRYAVPEDLSQQVLRRAERKILTEAPPPAAAIEPARPILRRLMNPRVWAYPALAVAVALIFMVFQKLPEDKSTPQQIALTTDTGEDSATESAFNAAEPVAEEESPAEESPAEESEEPFVEKREMKTATTRRSAGIPSKEPGDRRFVEREVLEEDVVDAPAAPQQPPASAAEPAPADLEAPMVTQGAGTRAAKGAAENSLRSESAISNGPASESAAKEKAPTVVPGKGGGLGGMEGQFARKRSPKKDISSEYGEDSFSLADRVIVVNVRGEQPRRETLTRLFADAGIDWEPAEAARTTIAGPTATTLARDALERVDRYRSVRPKQQDVQQKRSPLRPDARLVWVEATPAQIDAAIEGLKARAEADDARIVSVSTEETTDYGRRRLNMQRGQKQTRHAQSKLADDSSADGDAVTRTEPARTEPARTEPARTDLAGQQSAGESLGRGRGRAWFFYFGKASEVAQTLEEPDAAKPSEPAEDRPMVVDGLELQDEKLELQQQVQLGVDAQPTLQRALFVLRVVEPELPAAARQQPAAAAEAEASEE